MQTSSHERSESYQNTPDDKTKRMLSFIAHYPPNFSYEKIAVFVLKKSTDHFHELVLFFRQACWLKFAVLM